MCINIQYLIFVVVIKFFIIYVNLCYFIYILHRRSKNENLLKNSLKYYVQNVFVIIYL